MTWLRRTIRVLIALILVAAVYQAVAIWSTYRHEKAVAERIEAHGGYVIFNYRGPGFVPQSFHDRLTLFHRITAVHANTELTNSTIFSNDLLDELRLLSYVDDIYLAWHQGNEEQLARLQGLPITSLTVSTAGLTDAWLKHLRSLPKLYYLDLSDTTFANTDHVVILSQLTKLRLLNLRGTNVTDHDMVHLTKLVNLTNLDLSETSVTDEGVSQLAPMQSLTQLWLSSTDVTDNSVPTLKQLQHLEQLILDETRISDAGFEDLQRHLSHCEIFRE